MMWFTPTGVPYAVVWQIQTGGVRYFAPTADGQIVLNHIAVSPFLPWFYIELCLQLYSAGYHAGAFFKRDDRSFNIRIRKIDGRYCTTGFSEITNGYSEGDMYCSFLGSLFFLELW